MMIKVDAWWWWWWWRCRRRWRIVNVKIPGRKRELVRVDAASTHWQWLLHPGHKTCKTFLQHWKDENIRSYQTLTWIHDDLERSRLLSFKSNIQKIWSRNEVKKKTLSNVSVLFPGYSPNQIMRLVKTQEEWESRKLMLTRMTSMTLTTQTLQRSRQGIP